MVHTSSVSSFRHRRLSFGVNFTTLTVKKRHDDLCTIENWRKNCEAGSKKASPASRICQQSATCGLGWSCWSWDYFASGEPYFIALSEEYVATEISTHAGPLAPSRPQPLEERHRTPFIHRNAMAPPEQFANPE